MALTSLHAHPATQSCSTRVLSLFSYYHFLDVGNAVTLLVVIITWAQVCVRLADIRDYVSSVNATPTTFSSE